MVQRKIIALDDGHGDFGVTAGKRTPVFPVGHKYAGRFMYENAFNKDVVAQLGNHLIRCGFDVLYLAPTDADTPLKTRTDLANNTIRNQFNRPADILVSVHANALTGTWGMANGIETLWTKRNDEALAKVIHKHLVSGTELRDRGVKVANLHMTRESNMPACLCECAFMDNLAEAVLLMSDEYRAECAIEIAMGVCEYFGVKFIEERNEVVTNKIDITKERISLDATGKLAFYPLNSNSGKATDVRHIVAPKGKAKFELVYEKNKKTSAIVKSKKADLGINCTFYDMQTGVPTGYFKDSAGKVHATSYGKMLKWTQVNLMGDSIELSGLDTKRANASFQTAPKIVENGLPCYEKYITEQEVISAIADSKRQRTFLWEDSKGNIHIGIGDGGVASNKYDVGLTVKEMALYAIHHGAVWAVSLDGGGSTILADQTGGLNQKENTGANERTNHHSLLITLKTDEELKKENEKDEETAVKPVVSLDKVEVDLIKGSKKEVIDGFLVDSKTYVELRKMAEFLDAKVGWDQVNKRASATK